MSDYLWFERIAFFALGFEKEILEEIGDMFVIRDEDTVILTYPKSGTNWLIETVCLIQTKGNPKWIQAVPIWECSPWVETQIKYQIVINQEGPWLIILIFPSIFSPSLSSVLCQFQMIYVIRNSREVLVSDYFFFHKTILVKNPDSLINDFEWFLKGNILYGSRYEHTRAWLSMRERYNFLLLSYEDLKQDTRGTIEKVCDFLGKNLEKDELDLVLKYSSFQVMKENKMSNLRIIPEDVVTNGLNLMRKGMTEDWKNHFTVAQVEAFDKVF